MNELLLELLYRLEAIGDRDESLYDTVVREKMGDAVFSGFIRSEPKYVLPDDYGMNEDDNRAIKSALKAYIDGALKLAPTIGLDTFHTRLNAFQNSDVCTEKQKNYFDDFFGWSNPELFDEAGNVVQIGRAHV